MPYNETYLDGRVVVLVADITSQHVDAIVNAANSSLLGGGGVDGAIHRAGGPEILRECKEIRRTKYPDGLPIGKAVVTTGGSLPARYVIHTVGPVYGRHDGQEAELLAACYRNSLLLANDYFVASIAFPAISTGVFRYPQSEASAIASQAIEDSIYQVSSINEVRLVFFQPESADEFLKNQRFSKR